MCGLCCSFVSQNMPVTPKQKAAMFWQGLSGAAASWPRIVLWLLIIVQPSLKAYARVFGKQCGCVWIHHRQTQCKNTHLQNGSAYHVYHNNINLYAWEPNFFSEDVKYLQIPFQRDPGTCWWQVSSSGSSLDYTKQLAGPQWHAFSRYHGKRYVNTLKCVSNLCLQMWSLHVWRDQWPWNSSYCDFRKKNLEWTASGVRNRGNCSVPFKCVVPDLFCLLLELFFYSCRRNKPVVWPN